MPEGSLSILIHSGPYMVFFPPNLGSRVNVALSMISPALTLFGLSVCFHALWEQGDLLVLFQCDG